jgi:hypothetical protein
MRNKRKCAIINFWWSPLDGHGASLTALALYELVKRTGYTSPVLVETPFYNTLDEVHSGRHYKFIKRYAQTSKYVYSSHEDFKRLNQFFDDFIVGSDQVFRPEYVPDQWFLPDIDSVKRKVAVSASFGTSNLNLSNKRQSKLAAYLQKFDCISVREIDGINVYLHYFGLRENLAWIMDPVFLIERNFFSRIESNSIRIIDKRYIFFYILDMTSELEKLKNKLDKMFNIVIITDSLSITAEDFLHLVDKCEFVITDSYHGMCFSIIYNKPFIGFYNSERGISRVETLKIVFELNNIYSLSQINEINFDKMYNIDYEYINKMIIYQRKRGQKWISWALNNSEKDID